MIHKKSLFFVVCLVIASALSLHAISRPVQSGRPKVQAFGASASGENQQLFSFDFIKIEVFQEPDLARELEVSGEGYVTLPLIGKTYIKGLTISEAQDLIEHRYREEDILVQPQVNIVVLKPAERVIQILGQVNRPGPIIMPPSRTYMTLSEVIGAASDVNLRANASSVQVKSTDEEGQKYVYKVNFKKMRTSGAIEDVYLKDGDEVFVPESIF